MDLIIGTAGHIDHGKTSLVRSLTGVDTDRLPEEKKRGITIDLGFAEMLAGDIHFGFVDVPGHERFVKNMLAGASGIDIVMLVIAADEGVMPQTREHFQICRLLGIGSGIVVLTKTDVADQETRELARLDASELIAGSFLENSDVIEVSCKTGEGIESLRSALERLGARQVKRPNRFVTRLPVDRSFSIKGFGTVVTGTLVSGEIREGDELDLFPAVKRVRVRGLQTHGQTVEKISAGQRAAVNLGGIDHAAISRGMLLAEPGVLRTTQILDTFIEVLPDSKKPVRSRQRVRIHLGAAEVLARIKVFNSDNEIAPGKADIAQIRLEEPVVAIPHERFIIRSYSPQTTIAGGEILDALASKSRGKESAARSKWLLEMRNAAGDTAAEVRLFVSSSGAAGLELSDLQARTGLKADILRDALTECTASGDIVDANGRFVEKCLFEGLAASALKAIADFHGKQPLAKGMPLEVFREKAFPRLPEPIMRAVILSLTEMNEAVVSGNTIRLSGHAAELDPKEAAFLDNVRSIYWRSGLEVAKMAEIIDEAARGTSILPKSGHLLFKMLVDSGEVVKVTDEFYFSREAIGELTERIVKFASESDDKLIDVARFKEIAGVSRKYAIPLLEYFDRERITVRAGDKRLILK